MAKVAKIELKGQDILTSLRSFLKSLLGAEDIGGILVAEHLPMKNVVMPTLVTDPEKLDRADPLAPAFPINAAKVVSKLTRKPIGARVVAVLRPCEIRAFVELVKLKQGRMDDVVLVGIDCPGSFSNVDYPRFLAQAKGEPTLEFLERALSGNGASWEGVDISTACKACEYPIADNADISIGLFGVDTGDHLLVKANTPKGEEMLKQVNLPATAEPATRKEAIDALLAGRIAYRDRMFAETSDATSSLEKLMSYLSGCVNCYNCRVACPVCYCRECVFVTDVFDHEPAQYLRWAKRKGALKMPSDTVFYHLTRMVHMSTACIGCGQCSNACPNNIPVMELFRTIASHTQRAFNYEAGRSVEDEPPLSVFREKEFSELTGGKD